MRKFVRGLVAIAFFLGAILLSGQKGEAKTTEVQLTKGSKQLILQHAKELFTKKAEATLLAQHWSHSSHYSHGSHQSHYSHYSSRW